MQNKVWVYADGACRGNPGPAGFGIVLVTSERKLEYFEYLGPRHTNNIAELSAILRSLEYLDSEHLGACEITVYTDSQYAIGVLTKNWKAKANVELIASIKTLMRRFKHLVFTYVRGHSGVWFNEEADRLANQAIDLKTPSQWTPVPLSSLELRQFQAT